MSELTDAEVFTEAAHLIDTYGWRQGSNGNRDSGFRMAGAIMAALDIPPDGDYLSHPDESRRWGDLCHLVGDKLAKMPGSLVMGGITSWNDRPYRTKREVIALLRELAGERR
jgi:hypothetical protein